MTESIWPNQYDRNIWTWPKIDNDERELVEHDQVIYFIESTLHDVFVYKAGAFTYFFLT